MSLYKLRKQCGREWPAIAKAKESAVFKLDFIRQNILQAAGSSPLDSEDISVVVFGSLAREEWTSGSDLDWTLLIDGGADHEHAHTAARFREEVKESGLKQPGRTGIFGTLAFSHDLIHQIGGEDDSNRNTTRRMLLLLESRPINEPGAYDRVIRGVLNRYLENDFREFRLKVPRFLQNDLHRFWRTMCVDYANKYRDRAGEGWATRIVKLRMPRKLIFAAGLLTCFSCHPELLQQTKPDLVESPSVAAQVEYLRSYLHRPPLEIIAETLCRIGNLETTRQIMDSYDCFIAGMDDADKRDHLEKLPPKADETDKIFKEMIGFSRDFESGLQKLFFDNDPLLAKLTREYGMF
jgi:hypothetical protein